MPNGYASSESTELGGGGGASTLNRAAARKAEEQRSGEAEAAWLTASFRPFPSLLRWPTAPCFASICCMSALLQGAATILVAHKSAPRRAIIAAAVGAAFVLGMLLLLWTQLVVFARRHARLMWVPEIAPTTLKEVQDPALRLVSTLRWRVGGRLSSKSEPTPALHREKGAFAKLGRQEHESSEPERTERLLANPLVLYSTVASDAYESVAVTVLYKSRGDRRHAMAYHLGRLSVQVRFMPASFTRITCTRVHQTCLSSRTPDPHCHPALLSEIYRAHS